MGAMHVQRWRRYGKDRLYVRDGAGTQVGWVDLQTGAHQLDVPAAGDAFREAVASFCAAHDLAVPPNVATRTTGAAKPTPAPAPRSRTRSGPTGANPQPDGGYDLALNVPGQAARARADAELAAMRDRSRIGAFLARAFDMKTDERAWRVGAGGEETVGSRLEKLSKHGWYVLHAVPVGERDSDIDHVVIGPGGVWTVNTKNHPGKRIWVGRNSVRVNGQAVPYLRNSRFEAQRASRILTGACGFPVPVSAALVFLTGTLIPNVTIKTSPDGVTVLDRMDIPGAFRRTHRKLSDEQVAVIFHHARRSTTWTTLIGGWAGRRSTAGPAWRRTLRPGAESG